MQHIISLNNVNKTFGTFTAVNNLNLNIQEGEIYGFLGPNGGGKSTTLRMILGLLKPTSGTITIAGKNMPEHRSSIMNLIGAIIEKPDFYTYLNGIENLKLFARMHGINTRTYDFKKLLELVGLYGREKDKVKTYSHGMKQRLGLAQALLHNPKILILDEPNTGLDPQGIIELRNIIINLQKQEGKTILLSSHILSEIEEMATSMVVINKGKQVVEGKITQLLNEQDLLVNIECSNNENLLTALKQGKWNNYHAAIVDNQVQLHSSQELIPELVKYVSTLDIEIYSIAKSRKLENYFLKLTNA